MPATQKIITKLHERRQIEAELRQMRTARSEQELMQRARRIASSGSQVIPTIVHSLDQADEQMVAAMGLVATLLDRNEVVDALRRAVLHPRRTDQGRVAALTILERFLGLPPDDELLGSLENPESVALTALEEVLRRAEHAPTVLIDYIQGLDRQEPDVVLAVVRALQKKRETSCVEPLRMMAQDVRAEIAAAALEALGKFRVPEAAWALQTLIPIVHPELRPLAERMLRKLRFAGVAVREPVSADPSLRALIGPPNGYGRQTVWFILPYEGTQSRFLHVQLDDRVGAGEAKAYERISPLMLPLRQPLGVVHYVRSPDRQGILLMVEAPFDVGRRLVRQALHLNRQTQIPVSPVLRLLSPWLWEIGGADALPAPSLPEPGDDWQAMVGLSDRLLLHPALSDWTLGAKMALQSMDFSRYQRRSGAALVRRLADDLLAEEPIRRVIRRRLLALSEWLLLAGDADLSRLALATAQAIVREPPRRIPFVLALVRRDLEGVAPSSNQTQEYQHA